MGGTLYQDLWILNVNGKKIRGPVSKIQYTLIVVQWAACPFDAVKESAPLFITTNVYGVQISMQVANVVGDVNFLEIHYVLFLYYIIC